MEARGAQVVLFVRAVHRRLLLVRAAERVGWCALAACAAGLALTPVLLWRGQSALGVAAALLAGSMVAGVSWAVARPPTRLQAAVEADRQLRLHDLIGTALAILEDTRFGVPSDDPWMHSALAAAEARVRQVRPSEVVLARWGRRAWGGLGLATALLLTLATLSSNPEVTQATQETTPAQAALTDAGAPAPLAPTPEDRRIAQDSGVQDHSATEAPQGLPQAPPKNSRERENGAAGQDADATASTGGAQRAQTPHATVAPPPAPGAALTSSGAGATRATGAAPTDAGGTAASAARVVAPWQDSTAWQASTEQAQEALRSGRVPDEYRDLVGAYFQPQ
jgi:hypothetical protein